MRIPRSFSIKGKRWTVVSHKKPDKVADSADGLCEFEKRRIILRTGLSDEDRLATFLHEIVHATLFEAHLNEESGLKKEAEEIICDAIADVLISSFKLTWKRGRK